MAAGGASGGVVTKNGAMWNWGNKCATGRDDINLGWCQFFGHSVAMLVDSRQNNVSLRHVF